MKVPVISLINFQLTYDFSPTLLDNVEMERSSRAFTSLSCMTFWSAKSSVGRENVRLRLPDSRATSNLRCDSITLPFTFVVVELLNVLHKELGEDAFL